MSAETDRLRARLLDRMSAMPRPTVVSVSTYEYIKRFIEPVPVPEHIMTSEVMALSESP